MSLKTDCKPLSILTISHSQCFKSRSNIETKELFPKEIEDWGSDFTIHSLMRKYDNGKKMKNRVGFINDMTVLFLSKSARTSDRLLGALAESMTEGTYYYSERQTDIVWSPERYAVVGNITFERYQEMKELFSQSTFNERFLRCFYSIDDKGWFDFNFNRDERIKMKLNPKLKIKRQRKKVPLTYEQLTKVMELGNKLQIHGMYSGQGTTRDLVETIIYSNAYLNNRNYVTDNDFKIVDTIIDTVIINPYDKKIKVLLLLNKGMDVKTICEYLGYSDKSKALIYKYIREFKIKGILR